MEYCGFLEIFRRILFGVFCCYKRSEFYQEKVLVQVLLIDQTSRIQVSFSVRRGFSICSMVGRIYWQSLREKRWLKCIALLMIVVAYCLSRVLFFGWRIRVSLKILRKSMILFFQGNSFGMFRNIFFSSWIYKFFWRVSRLNSFFLVVRI